MKIQFPGGSALRTPHFTCACCILLWIWPLAYAADEEILAPEQTSKEPTVTPDGHNSLEYQIKNEEEKTETRFFPKIEELFHTQNLLVGLESGSDLLNHSVDSLMTAIFYNLLNQQFTSHITPTTSLVLGLSRKVFSTSFGDYVIADRMEFGPKYLKQIGMIHTIPISLGSSAGIDVLDIYLRTDAERLVEEEELPQWKVLINNWFGLVPLLTQILPPSFNANELYDPLRELQTPFVFPVDLESFKAMPIGSIRSYGISGGVQLPFAIDGSLTQKIKNYLTKMQLTPSIPYTLFIEGEHRINVLRKKENIAWVSASNLTQEGHSLLSFFGNTFYLLRNSIKPIPWGGIPMVFSPIDVNLSQELLQREDILYEFDLSIEMGIKAYLGAVAGDFSIAATESKKGEGSGVKYHFTQLKKSVQKETINDRNLYVVRDERKQSLERSEIKITDDVDTFYILEDEAKLSKTHWDVLIGNKELAVKTTVDLKVDKAVDNDQNQKIEYFFKKGENPYQFFLLMQITDRYMNVEQYKKYIALLKQFSNLPLEGTPNIPVRDVEEIVRRRKAYYMQSPEDSPLTTHVAPTVLGNFNATAEVIFTTDHIKELAKKSESEKWAAFTAAFEISPSSEPPDFYALTLGNLKRGIFYPTRLFNSRYLWADAMNEASHAVESLSVLQLANKPTEVLDASYDLFDSDYPENLLKGFYKLSNLEKIPRSVHLYFKPHADLPEGLKFQLKKLDGKVFSSTSEFPKRERYKIVEEKLAQFVPEQVIDSRDKPLLLHVGLSLEAVPDTTQKAIYVTLKTKNIPTTKHGKLYVRLEKSGKIHLGKFVLGQAILDLSSLATSDAPNSKLDERLFHFFLTGPTRPITGLLFDQGLDTGGEFLLSLAVAHDGTVFSKIKTFKFEFNDGVLSPPVKE